LPPNRTHVPGAFTYTGPAYQSNDPLSAMELPPFFWIHPETGDVLPTLFVLMVTAQL
jgi:hypothetical protein